MRVAVTGSSGLVGRALVRSLEADGHSVLRVVRGDAGPGATRWDPDAGAIDAAAFEGLDGVVHLAGDPIGPRRWSEARKASIRDSRVRGTRLLAGALAACQEPPRVLVSASASDVYGRDRGDEVLTERSDVGTEGFLTGVVREWEASTAAAEAAGLRVAHLRSAVVLDRRAGALGQMVLPFRLGLGGRFGPGTQWMSWISLADEVAAIRHLLAVELAGPVNACSPNPVTNEEFGKALARALHRPAVLPTPIFAVKAVYGAEMVDTLLLGSKRMHPEALLASGFDFRHPDIDSAMRAALSKED